MESTSDAKMRLTLTEAADQFGWSERTICFLVQDMEACAEVNHTNRKKFVTPEDAVWGSKSLRDKRDEHERAESLRLAHEITIHDLFLALERKYKEMEGSHFFTSRHRATLQYLEKAGFTRIDSIVMFQHTISMDLLRRLPKNQLLGLHAAILDAGRYNSYLRSGLRCGCEDGPTIGDVIKQNHIGPERWVKLRELGFGPEDALGLADKNNPQQILATNLILEEGLSPKDASRLASIAMKRGWG